MIIAISGKIGSGKNTIGGIINMLENGNQIETILKCVKIGKFPEYNYQQKSFASKLKQIVSILTGIPVEDLEKQEIKDRVLGEEWTRKIYFEEDGIKMKPTTNHKVEERPLKIREMLQLCGTEAMRNVIHPNVWVTALFADYVHIHSPIEKVLNRGLRKGDLDWQEGKLPNWIITDMRFPNELQAVKDRGGITIRVNRPGLTENNHLSETSLDSATFDYVIDNNNSILDLIEKVKTILIKENLM